MKKRQLQIIIFLFLISVIGCGCHDNHNQESSVEETMTAEYQSKEEIANNIENKWTQEYIDIINGDSFLYEQYALIFLDEDDIPELVGNNQDMTYQILSVSTEGKTVYYENLPYGTYSREYYYLPSQSSIVSTCTGIGGKGRYEEYYSVGEENLTYQMTIGKVPESDEEGNLLYDDAGNFTWTYEKNDSEITEEEWETLSVLDKRYVNFSQLPYLTQEEMVNVLKNPEQINESYSIVSVGNSDEMLLLEEETVQTEFHGSKDVEPEQESKHYDSEAESELTEKDFEIKYKDFIINGQTTADEIKSTLGIPEYFEDNNNGYIATVGPEYRWQLRYPEYTDSCDIRIIFYTNLDTDETTIKTVAPENIATNRGVKVGDNVDKIYENYGLPVEEKRYDANAEYLELNYTKENQRISFVIDENSRLIKYIYIDYNLTQEEL